MSDWREWLGADVLTLGMAADERRREVLGSKVVTYLRVHEIAPSGNVAAAAASIVPDAASEVRCYSLPATFDETIETVRALKAAAGNRRVTAYSFADLQDRGWSDNKSLQALVDVGLADVAELPADRLTDLDGAITALLAAGATPQRVTIAHPIADGRIDLIDRVIAAFERHTSLLRFSPLPRVAPVDKPTTGYDDVRMVASSRLALGARSIEVDWQLYGPKLAQVALTFGADHLDAVSASEELALGPRRSTVQDVERNIRAAGFEPKEYRHTS